jgi:hypothetical protein
MTTTTIENACTMLDAELRRILGEGIDDEQRACLLDPNRHEEAVDMIDDMECRLGISADVCGMVADALTQRVQRLEFNR